MVEGQGRRLLRHVKLLVALSGEVLLIMLWVARVASLLLQVSLVFPLVQVLLQGIRNIIVELFVVVRVVERILVRMLTFYQLVEYPGG